MHEGVLELRKYKWNLKNWAGVLLATQYFRVSSSGRAGERQTHGPCMGRYTLCQHAISSHASLGLVPVYKQDDGVCYLYLQRDGEWSVGPVVGDQYSYLHQNRNERKEKTCSEIS